MAPQEFGNLKTAEGVQKLNVYLASRSYISGYEPTQDDVATAAKLLGAPSARDCPHAFRWFKHITSFEPTEQATWPQGAKKEAPKKEESDDIDLFGDDDDGDLEALKAKKKEEAGKKKKVVINKSSLVIEIKPASESSPSLRQNAACFFPPLKKVQPLYCLLNLNAGADTDLEEVAKLAKAIKIEGVTWGEAVKKVPVAFGLFKLQLSCVILDDIVNTSDITDQLEALGLNEEQKEKLRKRHECGDDDDEDEDEDEETEGLVQSAEIVSFNKL